MPPYENLNDHERVLVETIVNYDVVAERCAANLRQYDRTLVDQLWAEGQGIFMGNPAKYPVITALQHNTDGKNRFRAKCQELCFPQESNKPRSPQEYIMMYFGAAAGMQAAYQDADEYPHRQDLCRIAKARSVELHSAQLDPDAADEPDNYGDEDPSELIDQKIRCRDKRLGRVMECVIVDYINSLVGGDYFVLEDGQGKRRNITPEELEEIRLD